MNLPVFICRRNGADTGAFTDGAEYPAVARQGLGFFIVDDLGHQRFVTDDGGLSPHLLRRWRDKYGLRQTPVGRFIVKS